MPREDALAEQLLQTMCQKHQVDLDVIRQLMEIERKHQFRDRRHGIYDELAQVIRASDQ